MKCLIESFKIPYTECVFELKYRYCDEISLQLKVMVSCPVVSNPVVSSPMLPITSPVVLEVIPLSMVLLILCVCGLHHSSSRGGAFHHSSLLAIWLPYHGHEGHPRNNCGPCHRGHPCLLCHSQEGRPCLCSVDFCSAIAS